MPTNVPYIFAGYTGNIPLSYLDANFANVKANVDHAVTADSATIATSALSASSATVASRAATVTTSAQPNITSVGILNSVSVSGNVTVGSVLINTGAVQAPLLDAANANISGNLSVGNVSATSNISASDTITGGNINISSVLQNSGFDIVGVNYVSVSSNAATTSLSTSVTRNVLIVTNTGYTHTVNMPTGPVDGQLTNFAVIGNTVILVAGTGTLSPSFAGSATAGTAYTYVYRDFDTTWYRTQ